MVTANAVTDSRGLRIHAGNGLKIGSAGHGTSKDAFLDISFDHKKEIVMIDLYDKNLHKAKLYEALESAGIRPHESIILQDDSVRKWNRKLGEYKRSAPKHYRVSIVYKGKKIQIIAGKSLVKFGIVGSERLFRTIERLSKEIDK